MFSEYDGNQKPWPSRFFARCWRGLIPEVIPKSYTSFHVLGFVLHSVSGYGSISPVSASKSSTAASFSQYGHLNFKSKFRTEVVLWLSTTCSKLPFHPLSFSLLLHLYSRHSLQQTLIFWQKWPFLLEVRNIPNATLPKPWPRCLTTSFQRVSDERPKKKKNNNKSQLCPKGEA